MRKNKYTIVFLFLGFFLIGLFYLLNIDKQPEGNHLSICFYNQDGSKVIIKQWTREGSDTTYFFLPSCVQLKECVFLAHHECRIGDRVVCDSSSARFFQTDSCYIYESKCKGCNTIKNIVFLKSENIASLHLSIQKDAEKKIHSDRNYLATIETVLLSANGSNLYDNKNVKIHCRGNSTWRPPKKSYVLDLPVSAELLGMPESKKWVLLANAFDQTNLRNAIVLDFARELGFAWTPRYDFVDLYLNGEYRGCYMLIEKIEIDTNRLDISSTHNGGGGALLCMVSKNRIKARGVTSFFITNNNQPLEIIDYNKQKKADIIASFQAMEDVIMSEDTLEQYRIADYLDLDSWVKKYLVDEIFENGDGGIRSSYFYTYGEGENSRIFGGPVWDYDMAIGNLSVSTRPNTFLPLRIHSNTIDYTPYYYKLYHNKVFYDRIRYIYKNKCVGLLNMLVEFGINDYAKRIEASSKMNSLRWERLSTEEGGKWRGPIVTSDDLILWLKQRESFLDSAWVKNIPYCLVTIENESTGVFYTYAVLKGELLQSVVNVDSLCSMNIKWYNTMDSSFFDFSNPINKDAELTIWKSEQNAK